LNSAAALAIAALLAVRFRNIHTAVSGDDGATRRKEKRRLRPDGVMREMFCGYGCCN